MTQSAEQRRLIRLAHAINIKAERVGAYGRVRAQDLAMVVMGEPTCHYCGVGLEPGHGTFDHVVPFDKGGANQRFNLVRCCTRCNREKYTKSPEELTAFRSATFACANCGRSYRPRYSDWAAGGGRYCSRSCSARSRW